MVKAKRRVAVGRRPRGSRTTKTGSTRTTSTAVSVETLREQADRLGLLDPLDEEPANVFTPGLPESER